MPPLHLIVDALLYTVLPALLLAAVVLAAVERLGGAKLAPLGAALGLAAGTAFGLWCRDALTMGASGWNRVPWTAAAALGIGLLSRRSILPMPIGWLVRAGFAAACAWWLVPAETRAEFNWLAPAFAGVIFLQWALLEPRATRPPGGGIPLTLAACAFVAAGVLIHAQSARLTDAALVLSAALGGIALVAWWRRLDAGGAVPGALVLLSGVLLVGQQETFSEIPWWAFALPALAPLMLVLTLPFRKWQGARLLLLRLALVLLPLAAAIALAMEEGPLEY